MGPFTTLGQVQRAVDKGHGALSEGDRPKAAYLTHPNAIEAFRETVEGLTGAYHCPVCRHPKLAHWDKKWNAALPPAMKYGERPKPVKPDWRPSGCVVPNCGCRERF